jgi:type 1 glutamine amidotransferase
MGASAAMAGKPKKVLFFSKSSANEHAVIKREGGKPSFVEKLLAEWGPRHGLDITCSKDGSLFTAEYVAGFDAFFFYTSGLLTEAGTDGQPAMSETGKAAFLDAVKQGKGFIGVHAASDTFHTGEGVDAWKDKLRKQRYHNYGAEADPYIQMLGGEFITHAKQQKAKTRVVDNSFPGFAKAPKDFEIMEEWYTLKDFAPNLHVLTVQETAGMTGEPYQRPPYPSTWARMHEKGRVFFTSMGHREETWSSTLFQDILFGALNWTTGRATADVTPNIDKVTPDAMKLPPIMPVQPAK